MSGGEDKHESLPPGFRFHPTDEELITYYLINKISDANFTGRAIADVDLNKSEPWELPGKAKMGEKEWYFFSLRDRKYPTGVRTNRATNTGYWKTTGKDKEIFNSSTSEVVGMKKTLVFYKGRAPRGEKSNWVMHEYRLHSKAAYRSVKDEWVVCRVFQKTNVGKKYPPTQPRGVNLHPYNLEMGPSILPAPAPMMPAEAGQFSMGRNYMSVAELAELTQVLRGSNGMNLPNQTQLNYPMGGGFSISGLNLNLGAAGGPATQHALRQMQLPPPPQPQMIQPDGVVSAMTSTCSLDTTETSYANMTNSNSQGGGRFMNVEQCLDLDNYWPPYN